MSTGFVATMRIASGACSTILNDHLLEDRGIAGQEFQAGFPRTLSHAAGEDHSLGPGNLRISAGGNADRGRKGRGIQDVFRLRPCELLVQIDEHHLAGRAAHHHRIGRAASDGPTPENAYFHGCDPFFIVPQEPFVLVFQRCLARHGLHRLLHALGICEIVVADRF